MGNFKLIQSDIFQAFNIHNYRGPLIENHLVKIFQKLNEIQQENLETFCIRLDLHFPDNYALTNNTVIEKFTASLRAKLAHSEKVRKENGVRVHPTNLRFIWCRELSTTGRPHYHVLLMLNKQAYAHIGSFDLDCENLYSRICHAWSSALGRHAQDTKGLIHFPDNPTTVLRRGDPQSFQEVFYRVSYFAKQDTKPLGQGFHTLGTSRKKSP